jgi:glycosyltransferase involved in cell wall biosynthesis
MDMSPPPLISVVITCYNYARYLSEAVESVIHQTITNWEIIIVNDGSTDESKSVAERLIVENPGRFIHLINQDNSGHPAHSRNTGIFESRGYYVLPLDADDVICPTMLEECLAAFNNNHDVSIVYTDRLDFDGVDQIVNALDYNFFKLKYGNHLSYCALFKRKVWEDVGGYQAVGYEDWDFWVSAGVAGHFGFRIDKPLFMYRRHDTGRFQQDKSHDDLLSAEIIIRHNEHYRFKDIRRAIKTIVTHGKPESFLLLEQKNMREYSLLKYLFNRFRFKTKNYFHPIGKF